MLLFLLLLLFFAVGVFLLVVAAGGSSGDNGDVVVAVAGSIIVSFKILTMMIFIMVRMVMTTKAAVCDIDAAVFAPPPPSVIEKHVSLFYFFKSATTIPKATTPQPPCQASKLREGLVVSDALIGWVRALNSPEQKPWLQGGSEAPRLGLFYIPSGATFSQFPFHFQFSFHVILHYVGIIPQFNPQYTIVVSMFFSILLLKTLQFCEARTTQSSTQNSPNRSSRDLQLIMEEKMEATIIIIGNIL